MSHLSQIGTAIYRLTAKAAALRLGTFDCVSGVYTRRSVACGEVVFGRSDIDVHILIHPFSDIQAEAQALNRLSACFARLRRLFPMLGDCDVSTRAELESWYRVRPFTWYRDRGWLRLYGEEFVRPYVPLTEGESRESLLWWFFWAWERLPQFFRARNVHTCRNLLLDMVNAVFLYTGEFQKPKSRADVARHWRTVMPATWGRAAAFGACLQRPAAGKRDLARQLYCESLILCHLLAEYVGQNLHLERSIEQVHCAVPFTFARRTYVVVDPLQQARVERALILMEQDATVFVTTAEALGLYLYHRNPWEYYTIGDAGSPWLFSPPSERALRRSVQASLAREIPRRVGWTLNRKGRGTKAVGLQYAQHRLYADSGSIASNAEELRQQYQYHYGAWPYRGEASRDIYFLHDYPILCQTIEEISQRLPCSLA